MARKKAAETQQQAQLMNMPQKAPETDTGATETALPWPTIGMNVKECAAALRISQRACQNMLASGELPARMVAGRWRISPTALDRWLDFHGTGKG